MKGLSHKTICWQQTPNPLDHPDHDPCFHGFAGKNAEKANKAWVDWFDKHLLKKNLAGG